MVSGGRSAGSTAPRYHLAIPERTTASRASTREGPILSPPSDRRRSAHRRGVGCRGHAARSSPAVAHGGGNRIGALGGARRAVSAWRMDWRPASVIRSTVHRACKRRSTHAGFMADCWLTGPQLESSPPAGGPPTTPDGLHLLINVLTVGPGRSSELSFAPSPENALATPYPPSGPTVRFAFTSLLPRAGA